MFLMSSDGFANSYKNETEFARTCLEYYEAVNQYGVKAIKENLKAWLSETSELGCGDDITVLMAYFSGDDADYSERKDPDSISEERAEINHDDKLNTDVAMTTTNP